MSVDSNLLNPQAAAAAAANHTAQPMSAPPSAVGGLTLPPLRLAIDERGNPAHGAAQHPPNGTMGYAQPSSYRVEGDGGVGGMNKDARQLGELGKTVLL